eukprot:TRINITY_DN40800_c0_g1_i1.p1 TRINITY_DN40800_c0_g1~~TRINITY_DN40800_c0_g1_i1.p1  ORF type:complete len:726 (+),score=58.49 TRINITY_DN40800_c0_g1_i1:136-2313(+)
MTFRPTSFFIFGCLTMSRWAGMARSAPAQVRGFVRIGLSETELEPDDAIVKVALFKMDIDQTTSILIPVSKAKILCTETASSVPADVVIPAVRIPTLTTLGDSAAAMWYFEASGLSPGNYTAMAFVPAPPLSLASGSASAVPDGLTPCEHAGGWLSFRPPRRQFMGFAVPTSGCAQTTDLSANVCSLPIPALSYASVEASPEAPVVNITMKASHYMPARDAYTDHGSLIWTSGSGFNVRSATRDTRRVTGGMQIPILRVWGTAYERGYAHGFLLAQQVMDMWEFFLWEDRMGSSRETYAERLLPALSSLAKISEQMQAGIAGMIAGMKASKISMATPLGRDLEVADIVALNTYQAAGAWTAGIHAEGSGTGSTRNKHRAHEAPATCSQFVFWGKDTMRSEVGGGTIAGRNMDGENDVRKTTVNLFVLHAVTPDLATEPGLQRFVHAMWPGFLGASSGFNGGGLYVFENSGCNPPGQLAGQMPLKRDIIMETLMSKSVTASPGAMQRHLGKYASLDGGVCVDGCIFVFAKPFWGNLSHPAGFIYEGDRNGGAMRVPMEFPTDPPTSTGIMATNHYFKYNADWRHPETCNRMSASFSSLARYFAGSNKVKAWMRTSSQLPVEDELVMTVEAIQSSEISGTDVDLGASARAQDPGAVSYSSGSGLAVGIEQMKELLRTVSHATTEHSVIFLPNTGQFHVAVADSNGAWDAPYRSWATFSFNDMFATFV